MKKKLTNSLGDRNEGETFVSLRVSIDREVKIFLKSEKMGCKFTQEGVVGLIDVLSAYREEGKFLYPHIYIVDDVDLLSKILSPSEFHKIGEGQKNMHTMLEAVKKCAPLTEEQWLIYILRKKDVFEYGIFRSGTSIISVPVSDTLLSKDGVMQSVILVRQIGERTVELRGSKASSIITTFTAREQVSLSPLESHDQFVNILIDKVPDNVKDQARTFYKKLMLDILHKGLGTLAVVVSSDSLIFPKVLQDGIKLEKKIDVVDAIESLQMLNTLEASNRIDSYFTLLRGMLSSDGVTIFADDGSVRGYNIFIKHGGDALEKERFGGSRKRTFNTLKSCLGDDLLAAFIQSKDGNIQFEHI